MVRLIKPSNLIECNKLTSKRGSNFLLFIAINVEMSLEEECIGLDGGYRLLCYELEEGILCSFGVLIQHRLQITFTIYYLSEFI